MVGATRPLGGRRQLAVSLTLSALSLHGHPCGLSTQDVLTAES